MKTLLFIFLLFGAVFLQRQASMAAIEENEKISLGQSSDRYISFAKKNAFKVSLFREAMKLGMPRSEVNRWGNRVGRDDVILEVATAIRADDVYKNWLERADFDKRQYVIGTVAKYAAKYGRSALAIRLLGELDDSREKLEVYCRLSFALGYEGNDMEMQVLLEHFEKMQMAEKDKKKRPANVERDKSKMFEEFEPKQWQECFLFAYHSGWAASGRTINKDLNRDVSTVLFRDCVRAYRANYLVRNGKLRKSLEQVRAMESSRLQANLLHLLINDVCTDHCDQSMDTEELGKELFEKYQAPVEERNYSKSAVFNLFKKFEFGSTEPIEGLPLVTSEIVQDVFELNENQQDASYVLDSCIKSGFCKDGIRKAKAIRDSERRKRWLKSILDRLEMENELQSAWSVRKKFSTTFGDGVAGGEAYLLRLVSLACLRKQFELAETFANKIKDENRLQDARFTLAAHRQSNDDLKIIKTVHPDIFNDFRRDLDAIAGDKQLEWLFDLGLRSLDERKLLVLSAEIKREFALRKESKSKEKVARMVSGAARSMTPLGEIRQSFMEELAEILGIKLGPRKATVPDIEKVLDKLQKMKREDTKLTKEEKQLLFRLCKESRKTMDAGGDRALAKVAVTYAGLGEKEEVTKLINLIKNRDERFFALLNCAMAYPPTSAPIFRGRTYVSFKREGGFLPGGLF